MLPVANRLFSSAVPKCVPSHCDRHNGEGQLGAGVEKDASAQPVKVAGDHMFGFISSGVGTTCAIEPHPTARAWCWG